MIALSKPDSPDLWQIDSFDLQQLDILLSGFNDSFDQPISKALWQWKYAGAVEYELCLWEGRQLIGHYGGMPRRILYFGQPLRAIQIGDVMVIPSRRGLFLRHGAFFQMATTFLERFVGFGKPFLLGFGFPNERAMRLAEHLGLYQQVDYMVKLSWSYLHSQPDLRYSVRRFDSSRLYAFAGEIDQLWNTMASTLSHVIIGIRDWHYIQQRYIEHPEQSYQFLILRNRFTRRMQSMAVVKINQQTLELLDILVPVSSIDLLIRHIRRFLPVLGCQRLECQINEGMAGYLKVHDFHYQMTSIRIPANSWTPGPKLTDIQQNWWLMAGDMDFC